MGYFTLRPCGCLHQIKRKLLSLSCNISPWIPVVFHSQITFENKHWKGTYVDPIELTRNELSTLHNDIKAKLKTNLTSLRKSSHYYFDQQGKLFRPMAVNLVGKACNHTKNNNIDSCFLSDGQRHMGMISEMIHTASLLHDDVIDGPTTRRNKPSINQVCSHKQAILAGDFILSRAAILLAGIGNTKAVDYFSHILDDLVRGELMQLVSKDDPSERFNHYLKKTYRKTASLLAYTCGSVALLGGCSELIQERAFNYGKNLGIAFQLVDDALDFLSTTEALGKPVGADMSLGIATAPVLFAAEKYPDLHALIGRRFKNKDDADIALDYVNRSDGIQETFHLAQKYANEAVNNINIFEDCIEKFALVNLCNIVIERTR